MKSSARRMRLVLLGFVAAVVLGGGRVKADFIWTQKAAMPTPRLGHTSAVVNGKIYVIGGFTSEPESRALSTVEEYDPVTNTWTKKADMPTARADMCPSTAVVNGKIYAIGGHDSAYRIIGTVEEYDPAADKWTRKADMPTRRFWSATCAANGKIYVCGGIVGNAIVGSTIVEQYDPAADTWTRKASMPTAVWGLSPCVVKGKIYAPGGRPGLTAIANVQEYDPATDTWKQKASLPVATSQMASVVLDNKMIVIGGWLWSNNYPYKAVQMYDPETDIWTRKGDVPFLRAVLSADVVNNRIYAIGGTDRPHPCPATSTVYEFGPRLDFNSDESVDIKDLLMLVEQWGTSEALCDIGPTPWGDGKVDAADLEVLMSHWGQEILDPALVACWKLDETAGTVAADSVGANHAILIGNPRWQPAGGKIRGALGLDGIDDAVLAPFVLNPSLSPFSTFLWVKGGGPGQVILSQQGAANWLMTDPVGRLMTELKPSRGGPLATLMVVTGGQWHRVGLTWDGTTRVLYVDDVEVARDAKPLAALTATSGSLQVGAGSKPTASSFWSGLTDDVRIYNRAVTP